MKSVKWLCLCLCLGLLVTGCGNKTIPKLENGQEVIVTLDGKEFSVDDLYAELKKQGGTSVLVNLVDNFIMEKEKVSEKDAETYADAQIKGLKAQYGDQFAALLTNAGYADEAAFKKIIISDYKKNTIADKYIQKSIADKEIEKYYKDSITGEMTARYILIKPEVKDDMSATEKKDAEEKALKEAKEVIAKLKDGEKFEDLAKEHSDDSSTAEEGGLYPNFVKTDVVEEFWNAAVALKDGKYTATPIKSSFGYFVILRIKQKDKPELEDVKDDILGALLAEKKEADAQLIAKTWVNIRKEYGLDIIDSDLNKEYDQTVKKIK